MSMPRARVGLFFVITATVALAAAIALAQAGHGHPSHIPPGRGWFCFDDPQPAGGTLHSCDRPLAACDRLVSQRRSNGETVGSCGPVAEAYCFSFVDGTTRPATNQHYCAQTQSECTVMNQRVAASGPIYSHISACEREP